MQAKKMKPVRKADLSGVGARPFLRGADSVLFASAKKSQKAHREETYFLQS